MPVVGAAGPGFLAMGEVGSSAADLLSTCNTERGHPSDSTTGAEMRLVWKSLGFVHVGVPALGEMGGQEEEVPPSPHTWPWHTEYTQPGVPHKPHTLYKAPRPRHPGVVLPPPSLRLGFINSSTHSVFHSVAGLMATSCGMATLVQLRQLEPTVPPSDLVCYLAEAKVETGLIR